MKNMSFSDGNSSYNLSDQFPALYENRYCVQEEFSIAVFDGKNNSKNVSFERPFFMNSFDSRVHTPSVLKQEYGCKAIGSGCDIY